MLCWVAVVMVPSDVTTMKTLQVKMEGIALGLLWWGFGQLAIEWKGESHGEDD